MEQFKTPVRKIMKVTVLKCWLFFNIVMGRALGKNYSLREWFYLNMHCTLSFRNITRTLRNILLNIPSCWVNISVANFFIPFNRYLQNFFTNTQQKYIFTMIIIVWLKARCVEYLVKMERTLVVILFSPETWLITDSLQRAIQNRNYEVYFTVARSYTFQT